MENKKIFCEIHNGILEDPYQCYFCKRYCCKDCIENYYGKICPFCKNEKKFNSDIRLKSELRTKYKKCEKCEKYFDHLNIKNHKDKCEKKIIHCYFCNFVGEKEKFIEHFYKKHKKILINDLEKIINFDKTNEKNYNFNDLNSDDENEDLNLYDCYIKQKSSDYINENMIQTERNNLIRNKKTFENKFIINNNYVYDKQNNPSSTRNKQSQNFIFETPINNKNNNNNNNYYNNNNNNNYYNNNNNNNYYNNNNNNNYNNNNNNNKNNNNKFSYNFVYESLYNLIKRNKKKYNIYLNESFDFSDFLAENGFKFYILENEINNNDIEINLNNDINIFPLLMFYIFLFHKLNLFYFIDEKNGHYKIFFNSLNDLNEVLKKEIYEMFFLILNGYIRYFIYKSMEKNNKSKNQAKENNNNNNNEKNIILENEDKNFNKILMFYKILFEKYLKENINIRKNLNEIVEISPDLILFQNIENSLSNEINYFEENYLEKLLNLKDILNHQNFNKNIKVNNFFESFLSNENNNILTIYEIIFDNNDEKKNKLKQNLNNIIKIIFNSNKEFNLNILNDSQKIINILLSSNIENLIDKIIFGNIDKYKNYFSSKFINSLIIKIKKLILKILMNLNILYIKYKILTINPINDKLDYFKLISFLIIFNKENFVENFFNFVNSIIFSIKNKIINLEERIFNEILIFLNYSLLNNNNDEIVKNCKKKLNEFENFIKSQNSNIYEKYILNIKNLQNVFEKFQNSNSNDFFILFYTNKFFLKTSNVVFHQLITYSNLFNQKIPLNFIKEKYFLYCENFENLTSIHKNSLIDFKENWELIHNHQIFSMITTEKFKAKSFFNQKKFEMFLNERQKNIENENLNDNNYNKIFLINKKIKNFDNNNFLNDEKIKIKEEIINVNKIKFKINYNKNNNKNTENSTLSELNDSIVYVKNKNNSPIEKLIINIKKIFFNQFLNFIFEDYKNLISSKELEEIKVININKKNNSIEISNLKEKFLIKSDYIKNNNNLNEIKKFDLIKLNKYQNGISENSQFFKDLVKHKKVKHLNELVKERIKTIQEKLNEYEIIMNELNKEFKNINNQK